MHRVHVAATQRGVEEGAPCVGAGLEASLGVCAAVCHELLCRNDSCAQYQSRSGFIKLFPPCLCFMGHKVKTTPLLNPRLYSSSASALKNVCSPSMRPCAIRLRRNSASQTLRFLRSPMLRIDMLHIAFCEHTFHHNPLVHSSPMSGSRGPVLCNSVQCRLCIHMTILAID